MKKTQTLTYAFFAFALTCCGAANEQNTTVTPPKIDPPVVPEESAQPNLPDEQAPPEKDNQSGDNETGGLASLVGGGVDAGVIGVGMGVNCPCGICPDSTHDFAPDGAFPDDYDTSIEEPGLETFLKDLTGGKTELESVAHWKAIETIFEAGNLGPGDIAGTSKSSKPGKYDRKKRLASLRSALGNVPKDCEPRFEVGDGYGMLAFPPAMTEDSEEDAATVNSTIDYLQTGYEVAVTCMYRVNNPEWDEEENVDVPETIAEPRPALMLNVLRDDDGKWKIIAWAAMGGALNGAYPD